ncbi:MAG TPA: plasmid stabilization protein [Patescibacteria group bacterium]|nr:plasmid stabilization protein [Patescibacteria group bacterium]
MYTLHFLKTFDKSLSTLTKKNKLLKKKIENTLVMMMQNPSYPSLRVHKVETKKYGRRWSVSVDQKIRIIWDFDMQKANCIVLLDVGSHTIYK